MVHKNRHTILLPIDITLLGRIDLKKKITTLFQNSGRGPARGSAKNSGKRRKNSLRDNNDFVPKYMTQNLILVMVKEFNENNLQNFPYPIFDRL
jgi:hypothetical protein